MNLKILKGISDVLSNLRWVYNIFPYLHITHIYIVYNKPQKSNHSFLKKKKKKEGDKIKGLKYKNVVVWVLIGQLQTVLYRLHLPTLSKISLGTVSTYFHTESLWLRSSVFLALMGVGTLVKQKDVNPSVSSVFYFIFFRNPNFWLSDQKEPKRKNK